MLDGVADTQPNADGILPELIVGAGLRIENTHIIPTPTGAIPLFRALSLIAKFPPEAKK